MFVESPGVGRVWIWAAAVDASVQEPQNLRAIALKMEIGRVARKGAGGYFNVRVKDSLRVKLLHLDVGGSINGARVVPLKGKKNAPSEKP